MDSNVAPTVSVVLPAYNAEKYLKESIDSILAQTYTDFELLVINNASTDGTRALVESYTDPRVKLINNPSNLGLIGSLNVGLKAARGKYIARMDHDDRSLPERFQKEIDFLEKHPEVAIVGTWSNIMDSNGKFIRLHRNATRSNVIKYELMYGNSLTHPSLMMRRKEILELGGYDPKWVNTEDYELYSRAIRKYRLANIPEPLIFYRVHGASLTQEAESQAVMHENTKQMIFDNISYYLPITSEEHRLVTQVLIARFPNKKQKLSEGLAAHRLHKRIYQAFIAKEKNNLDGEDRSELHSRYIARRNLMFRKYLAGKYHLITRKNG